MSRAAPLRAAQRALWWGVTLLLLAMVARVLEARVSWYLSVDQYGYLSFARDLAQGRVFHDWPPFRALAPRLPPVVDVLSQSYVADHGRIYCRYAPGFPLLLAAWQRLVGEDGVHAFNPVVFLVLLALLTAFQRRLFHSRWRATVGLALFVLLPTVVHQLATTVLRDLSAHLAAFAGLFLLLPRGALRLGSRRAGAAGLSLGYACSIRPDALLYLLPAALLVTSRWRRDVTRGGPLAVGAVAFALGLVPLLAYNWAATGSPLRLTQGMEIEHFLPPEVPRAGAEGSGVRVGFPPPGWRGGTIMPVQGGSLRLANLPRTLPGNVLLLRLVYGDLLLGVAAFGALLALVQRRPLFLVAVPYPFVALLFFSCWSHAEMRYLAGIQLFVPMLLVEGTFGTLDLVRRLARLGRRHAARALALAAAGGLAVGLALVPAPPGRPPLPLLAVLVPAVAGSAALAAAAWPHRRIVAWIAPLLAVGLVAFAGVRGATGSLARAPFQGPETLEARATFARVVSGPAVVITTEEVGRPAENIEYYSGTAHALYLTDLRRWRLPLSDAARALAAAGFVPYLLLPVADPDRAVMLRELSGAFSVEVAADIPAREAIAYFVASTHHEGVHLVLYRLMPTAAE